MGKHVNLLPAAGDEERLGEAVLIAVDELVEGGFGEAEGGVAGAGVGMAFGKAGKEGDVGGGEVYYGFGDYD